MVDSFSLLLACLKIISAWKHVSQILNQLKADHILRKHLFQHVKMTALPSMFSPCVLSVCLLPYLSQIGFINFCPGIEIWGCSPRAECENKFFLTSRFFLIKLPSLSSYHSFPWQPLSDYNCLRSGFSTNWFFCLCNVSCGLTRTKV